MSSAGSSASSAPVGPELSAEVVQYRRDAQRDVVQVKVTNHAAEPVHVDRVEVVSPTFTTTAGADKDSTVGAGLSVHLTVPLADPACSPEDAGDGAATVRLDLDGRPVELAVGDDVLREVRAARCAEQAVGEVVALVWQPAWTDAGTVDGEPGLRGRLRATPVSSAPVTLRVEGATTLFTVDETVTATTAGTPVVLDVVVTVTRCDPHAVAEDKKGYLFPVRVQVADEAEVLVEVAVPVPERAQLQALIERTCY